MTQPPDGYPSPEPGRQQPPPADPFPAPPAWDQPTRAEPRPWAGAPTPPHQPPARPPQYPPGEPYRPGGEPPPYGSPPPGREPPPYGSPSPYSGPPPYGPADQPPGAGGPGFGGPPPGGGPPYGPPPGLPPHSAGPPRRRRRRLLIGAMLVGVLLLCAGGGTGAWLLTRDPDRNGADTPVGAAESFLQAVYRDQDAGAAAAVVCDEARDEGSLENKIDELRTYQETTLHPTFSWTKPAVVEETEELAILAVTVTMTTDDELTAEQTLRMSVLDKDPHGWWVCDLETVDGDAPPGGGEPSGSPAPSEPPAEDDGE